MWTWITVSFFAYSGLTLLYLFRGPRSTWLKGIVLPLSVAAIAAGLYGIVSMLNVAKGGGHFEGYLVLMGLIVGGHGLTAIIYTFLSGRVARVAGMA
jgi:hypothetical protein